MSAKAKTKTKKEQKGEEQIIPMTKQEFLDQKISDQTVTINEVDGITEIAVNNYVVLQMTPNKDGFTLDMLPDIYMLSNWNDILVWDKIRFNLNAEGSRTVIAPAKADVETILGAIHKAVYNVNLYGYIIDKEDNE